MDKELQLVYDYNNLKDEYNKLKEENKDLAVEIVKLNDLIDCLKEEWTEIKQKYGIKNNNLCFLD